VRIRELLDVKVALYGSRPVAQKEPRRAQRVAELVEAEWVVRADNHLPGVCDAELRIALHQIPEKTMFLKFPENPSLVLQLVIRERSSNNDVFSQPAVLSDARNPLGS
jgi:hypothetical protein